MTSITNIYARQTPWTHPGSLGHLYDELPDTPDALCPIPRNVLLHDWEANRDGLSLGDRRSDLEIRSIAELLQRIVESSSESLLCQRNNETFRVVDCRHFATLLCSMLRHKKIPARVRFGFAGYITEPNADPPYEAHAVCEWRDRTTEAWRLSDADIVEEVTHEQFCSADQAWRIARSNPEQAPQYGYGPDMRGLNIIAAELVRDVACRAGFEPIYGDMWGLATDLYRRPIHDDEIALFDNLAAAPDATIAEMLAADSRTFIPTEIYHFAHARGTGYSVNLAQEREKLVGLGVSFK